MPDVTFVEPDGTERIITARANVTLMEVATRGGVAGMRADCGGACACATCHVRIAASWAATFPPVGDVEELMLEFVDDRDGSSRLSCQLTVSDRHHGLRVTVPAFPERG